MEDILLCNGVKMPQEGFGVFQIPPQDCKEVVLNAIRAGYRLLDTASSYKNEEAVGEAIREAVSGGLVKRGELFVTTKAYIQEMPAPWKSWALIISICISSTCLWAITTAHGGPWRSCTGKEGYAPSACAISTRPG